MSSMSLCTKLSCFFPRLYVLVWPFYVSIVARATPRYWVLTDGRAVNWSVQQLAAAKLDELVQPAAKEAYDAVGEQMGLTPLGMMEDIEFGA